MFVCVCVFFHRYTANVQSEPTGTINTSVNGDEISRANATTGDTCRVDNVNSASAQAWPTRTAFESTLPAVASDGHGLAGKKLTTVRPSRCAREKEALETCLHDGKSDASAVLAAASAASVVLAASAGWARNNVLVPVYDFTVCIDVSCRALHPTALYLFLVGQTPCIFVVVFVPEYTQRHILHCSFSVSTMERYALCPTLHPPPIYSFLRSPVCVLVLSVHPRFICGCRLSTVVR